MVTLNNASSLENTGYLFQSNKQRRPWDVNHTHDFFEFAIVYSGKIIHNINGRNFIMKRGEFVLIKPGIAHRISPFSDSLPGLFTIAASAENFSSLFDFCAFSKTNDTDDISIFELTDTQLTEISEEFDAVQGINLSTRSLHIMNIILKLLIITNDAARLQTHENYNAALALAMQKMHYSEYLCGGVDTLAKLSNYSRAHLCKLMQKIYGCTPHEYINSIKISKAKYLLKNTDKSILAIATELGFSSQSHFIGMFKKSTSKTPLSYRNSNT